MSQSPKKWGKGLSPEVYVISYPKSGRTWLRALVGKALSDQYSLPEEKILETEFMTINASIPCTSFTHDGWDMIFRRKWHEMPADRSKYKDNKIILLGRDVKDTLVSAYFQATKRIMVFDGSMSEFLRSEQFGAMKLLKFYETWWNARSIPKEILFVRYEDLHLDTEVVLRQVLDFMGANEVRPDALRAAMEYASFQNLRQAEESNRFKTRILKAGRKGDPESFKVRKGKVGGYREYLSMDDIQYVDGLLDEYGCEFSRNGH